MTGQSLVIACEIEDRVGQGILFDDLGTALLMLTRLDDAEQTYHENVTAHKEIRGHYANIV